MPVAMSPDHEWDYVLKDERETADPTVFVLGVLSSEVEATIEDALVKVGADKTMTAATGSQVVKVLRFGLRGWRNFRDGTGAEVPFPTSKAVMDKGRPTITDAGLTMLAPKHRRELADAIVERNTVTEVEAKNSSSAPVS